MDIRIQNEFWNICFAGDHPLVTSLAFDASGQSRWCANLLKAGSPVSLGSPIAGIHGAQSGYFDASKQLHVSSSCSSFRISRPTDCELLVRDISYGSVHEQWRLRVVGARLVWKIEQRWISGTGVLDGFFPGLFFTAHAKWGEATVFQLWDRAASQDDFYGISAHLATEGSCSVSRRTRTEVGGWSIAKLLSHARPNGDLRVSVNKYLKKGELLNYMSFLAQGLSCEPEASLTIRGGESIQAEMTLEPVPPDTGLALDIDLRGDLQNVNAVNRRLFDTHVNCAIMADTRSWRFGNEPSGYVALLCQYMYSEMVKYGVMRGQLGQDCVNARQVLTEEVEQMAANLLSRGTIGSGYMSANALDLLPSFLLAMRDSLVTHGDRAIGEQLFPAAWLATRQLIDQLAQGHGMIFAPEERAHDYWDWIARNGRLTSVNVLVYMGLLAFGEMAKWLGRGPEYDAVKTHAQTIKNIFNEQFWSEERGFYADWIDSRGNAKFFLYAGPQLQAIVAGMAPPGRARKVVESIQRRRRELGQPWSACFSLQTNLFDAEEYSTMFRKFKSDQTRFGQTMNGGCLLSWNYYWIGALVTVGMIDEAIRSWSRVVGRFAATSLVEGSNFWDYSGQPSRTTFPQDELAAYEPFLSDQGLVSVALPRWLLGIELKLDGISVAPVLPPSEYPITLNLFHLGKEVAVEIPGLTPTRRGCD